MTVASYRSPKTAVRPSRIAGRGLFAAAPLARGEVVCVKGGHLVDRATLERHRAVVNDAELQVADDLFLAPLSADEFEGVMMFLNHSCEPNVGLGGNVVLVAMRNVAAGEELTTDYALFDDHDDAMACTCGTPSCRQRIHGEDWQRPDLQERYRGWFSWYLQRKMPPAGVTGRR
jgi:uncharacterized protein